MRDLKFCGAMINGHTNGQYLDHPSLDPFWERAQALGALVYLHPADPVTPAPVLDGHKGCGAPPGNGPSRPARTRLRIIFGGVFDRFPRARLALGHLGETLPFLLWRFDSRAGPGFYAVKLAKLPSQYVKDNIVVATSGMCSAEPLNCTIGALGHDHVMFAADYPFESVEEAGHFIDGVALDERVRNDICFDTAAWLLKLLALRQKRSVDPRIGGRNHGRRRYVPRSTISWRGWNGCRPRGGRSRRASSSASPPSSTPSTRWRSPPCCR